MGNCIGYRTARWTSGSDTDDVSHEFQCKNILIQTSFSFHYRNIESIAHQVRSFCILFIQITIKSNINVFPLKHWNIYSKQMSKQLNRSHINIVFISLYTIHHANLQAPRLAFVSTYAEPEKTYIILLV